MWEAFANEPDLIKDKLTESVTVPAIILDNETRWNSSLDTTKRGIKLAAAIEHWASKNALPAGIRVPSVEDWETFKLMVRFLKPFKTGTFLELLLCF